MLGSIVTESVGGVGEVQKILMQGKINKRNKGNFKKNIHAARKFPTLAITFLTVHLLEGVDS